MTIELSDDQLNRLIGIMAENKVAILEAFRDLKLDLDQKIGDLKIGLAVAHSSLGIIEEDLGKVQRTQRAHTQTLDEVQGVQRAHTQSIEGLTELSSTNFDMIESLNKHIHGESSTISHADANRGTRTQ